MSTRNENVTMVPSVVLVVMVVVVGLELTPGMRTLRWLFWWWCFSCFFFFLVVVVVGGMGWGEGVIKYFSRL